MNWWMVLFGRVHTFRKLVLFPDLLAVGEQVNFTRKKEPWFQASRRWLA